MGNAIPEAASVLGSFGPAILGGVAVSGFAAGIASGPLGKLSKAAWNKLDPFDKGLKKSSSEKFNGKSNNSSTNVSNSTHHTKSDNRFKNQHSDSFNSFSNDSISGNKNQNSQLSLFDFYIL